jgi:ribosomal protein L11 methylase PrmA
MPDQRIAGSFRDPSGFIYTRDGVLYRQVNLRSKADYDLLMSSGLYGALVKARLLVAHEEAPLSAAASPEAYKVLRPERVPFISYPYEWCFTELKAAALATLNIEKKALDHGMCLKDASAYNIQFVDGRPVLIDTLSFEKYRQGEPWVAYKQFCQHFLAPLALMSRTDIRLGQLLRVNIDGIPVDLARKLLPWRTKLKLGLFLHIHLHGKYVARDAQGGAQAKPASTRKMTDMQFRGIIDSLESAVKGLSWRPAGTEWADYYNDTNYSEAGMRHKETLVGEFLDKVAPKSVWDLGANTGVFSRVAAAKGARTVAFDIDPAAVEKNYLHCAAKKEKNILPLLMDLTNPSPSLGWQCSERDSLAERGPADAVLALALIHHLAIGNNVPLESVAEFFASLARTLVIEFVPKTDSQVARLLVTREDIFDRYTQDDFEKAFAGWFVTEEKRAIEDTERTLYLMRRK